MALTVRVVVELSSRLSDQVDKLIEAFGSSADTTALEQAVVLLEGKTADLQDAVGRNSVKGK